MEKDQINTETNESETKIIPSKLSINNVASSSYNQKQNIDEPNIKIEINLNNKLLECDELIPKESQCEQSEEPYNCQINNCFDKISTIDSSNKGKVLYTNVSEKKNYLEKIKILNNRIKKLNDHEENINQQVKQIKLKVNKKETIRENIDDYKQMIYNNRVEVLKECEEKRKYNDKERTNRKNKKDKLKASNVEKKRNNFELVKKEKDNYESIIHNYNTFHLNVNNTKYFQLKQELIDSKAKRLKKYHQNEDTLRSKFYNRVRKENREKNELLEKLKILENEEADKLENIKKTINIKQKEISDLKKNLGVNNIMRMSNSVVSSCIKSTDANINKESSSNEVKKSSKHKSSENIKRNLNKEF